MKTWIRLKHLNICKINLPEVQYFSFCMLLQALFYYVLAMKYVKFMAKPLV